MKKGIDSPLGSECKLTTDSNLLSRRRYERLLQIGEFSRICQVSVKTLHHYDKIGLLVPAQVDQLTGYRYYKTEQIDRMNYIQSLKGYGLSLEEIQHLIILLYNKDLAAELRSQNY